MRRQTSFQYFFPSHFLWKEERDIFISMHLITNIQLKCIQSKKYSNHIFSDPLFHWHMKEPKFMRGELLVEFKGAIWPSQVSPIPQQLCWGNTDYDNSAPRDPQLRHLNRCDALSMRPPEGDTWGQRIIFIVGKKSESRTKWWNFVPN